MTRRPMTAARPGSSLLEVLVGLGIMAVGAIGAFVLFPLSAINVSRALIDDRTTTCAVTADGQLRDIHRQYVVEAERNGNKSGEQYFTALDAALPAGAASGPSEPSAPVFVDPMGVAARAGSASQTAVGDSGQTTIPRVNLNFIAGSPNPNPLALRFCSQMDGLTFTEGGNVPGGVDMRELRYNWLWVLQRPVNRDRYTVRMQVVVFDKRAHLFAPPGSESVQSAAFVPGTTEIANVPLTAEVRKGSWVMDGTVGFDPANRPLRHAEFYRVTSVNDAGGSYTLEVHKPIVRADGLVNLGNPAAFAYTGSLVVMPAVVEVFERPVLTGETQ